MSVQPFVAPPRCFRLLSDWPWEFPQPRPERLPRKGALVFQRLITGPDDKQRIWSELNQGYSRHPSALDLESHPVLTSADIPALLEFYLLGWEVLPNWKFEPLERGLDQIACWGGAGAYKRLANIRLPYGIGSWRGTVHTTWARVFLSYTQGGQRDGRGVHIWHKGQAPRNVGHSQVASFALCQHTKRTISSIHDQQRGWHPGHCTRCGLDLTVDSSD